MTNPENSKHIEQLAAGYVVGNLAPEEAKNFQQLLAENPELVTNVDCLQEVLEQVICGLNEVEPPPHLRSAIFTTASSDLSQKPIVEKIVSLFPWGKIAGSVAALLILYLGINNYNLRNNLKFAQEINILLQDSETRLLPLEGANLAKTASGSFMVNLDRQKGVIAIQNLPAPPVGKIYRLWAVVDGDKIPCGQLSNIQKGQVLEKVSMPADFYDAGISGFLVTLESSSDRRYPVGPVVIKSL